MQLLTCLPAWSARSTAHRWAILRIGPPLGLLALGVLMRPRPLPLDPPAARFHPDFAAALGWLAA
jgi:hypothetical protein